MLENNKSLELRDVVSGVGEASEIDPAKLRSLIVQKTGLRDDSQFLTDMVGALEIERETWVSDDEDSYNSLQVDTLNKAIQVILLQDAIENKDKIEHFKKATARSAGTAGSNSSDPHNMPDIDWGNGVGCYPDPVCGGGGGGGSGDCGGGSGDGCLIALAVIIACCSCIAAGCAGKGLMRSTTDAEPRSVTFVKRATPVVAGIGSLLLMIQYANTTMYNGFCAYLINQHNNTGPCKDNKSESAESKFFVYSTDVVTVALTFALMACLFSQWRTAERTDDEVACDMKLHAEKLMQVPEVASLVHKLGTESKFVTFLKSAKDKGDKEYEAVKIILEAIRVTLGATDNELVIDVQPTNASALAKDSSTVMLLYAKNNEGGQKKGVQKSSVRRKEKGKAVAGDVPYMKL